MEFIVNHREPVSRENVELSPLDVVIAYGKHNDMANTLLKKGFKPKNLQVYYRDIKSFIFAYKHRFFPPGFSIFEPALKYGKGDIIRFLISKGHKIIVHKNMVRTIGRGVRTLWKMGHKLQPIIDDKTGFVGDSEWLEEQWQKIAEGACGGNHRDMVTLESIGEQFIKIVLPGGHIRCYPKNSTLKFMKANVFADWVPNTPGEPMEDMGYGGGPGRQRFVRTLDGTWLTYDSARRIAKATPSHFTFNAVKVARNQRIGNLRGTFGVSENHGQLPGFTVYELQPVSVSASPRVMSMHKDRASERTRLMMPKGRRVPHTAYGGAGGAGRLSSPFTVAASHVRSPATGLSVGDRGISPLWKHKTVSEIKIAAMKGDATAQGKLGELYYSGRGVKKDYRKAIEWFRKAAGQGYAFAQYDLGYMFEEGLGVDQDYREAIKWYRKAADQGHANAQNQLVKLQSRRG